MPEEILIDHYDYSLPEDRIAQEAAEPRDSSRLLLYKQGQISDHRFTELSRFLPDGTSLFLNNAKVIPARLILNNSTGARIEVFLLQPEGADHVTALNAIGTVSWNCLIGNRKKLKAGEVLQTRIGNTLLALTLSGEQTVRFEWDSTEAFAELIALFGSLPLPPYIKHKAEAYDRERYQTVYSAVSGSVAAPTAGLHFSDAVINSLENAGIPMHYVTLHVSAGTFLPVKVNDALQHPMHSECFTVDAEQIRAVRDAEKTVAVGTTSCRVLESLYWGAVNLYEGRPDPFNIAQFDYQGRQETFDRAAAMDFLLNYLEQRGDHVLSGASSIMIVPGYKFRVVEGLITNFHQPKSTLLLLISALLGDDWKKVYKHALDNGYRFLSYGDSSLLLP